MNKDNNHKHYAKKVLSGLENKLNKDPENPYGVDRSKEDYSDSYNYQKNQNSQEFDESYSFQETSSRNYLLPNLDIFNI